MADVKIEKTDSTTEKPKVDLGLLEEDDEFEEFPADGNISYYLANLKLHLNLIACT
jgi:hypothetical protein